MKTISIRDLRRLWPKAEAALKIEGEILITRRSRPVAKLVRIAPPKAKSRTRLKRWDPDEHMLWLKKVHGDKVFPSSDSVWASARADREMEPT